MIPLSRSQFLLFLLFLIGLTTICPNADSQLSSITEEITIENISSEIINGVRIVSTYLENEDSVHQKTYIPPGEKRKFTVKVWQGGSFTTNVHFRFENEDILSRPFTANLTSDTPITPVTLQFGGGKLGMWKGVIWADPI